MRKGNTRNRIFKILAILFMAMFCIKILPQTAIKVFIRTNPLMNIGTSSSLYNNYWANAQSQDTKQNIEYTAYYYYDYYYRKNGRDITADMKKYILDNANNINYTYLGSRGIYVLSSDADFRASFVYSSGGIYGMFWDLFFGDSSGSSAYISRGGGHRLSRASSCSSSAI